MPRTASRDMGSGNIKKLMLDLAIPAVVAQVINLLYNIVDRIYIGHIPEIGGTALTGVGLCAPILMLLTAFAMMPGSGGAPRAAIAMGRGDNKEAEHIMGNCFTTLLIFSAVLTVGFYIFAPQLLMLFGASEYTLPYAVEYARIYTLGSVFVLVVMGMNPFITTQGFAKISMLTTVIGAVVNIVLDPIFIFLFDLGVSGAAIATVLSQAISAVWILRFLTGKKTVLHLRPAFMKLSSKIILPCLALGVSTFVMLSTESLLSISFTSSLSRFGGDLAVGAMTVLNSMNMLLTMPLQGICQGGQPIISFNFGAGNKERVKEAFRCQFVTCVAYAVLYWVAVMLMPHVFSGIFTSDTELVRYTTWAMRIFLCGAFSIGFQISCQQAFLALGEAKISLLLACLRKLVLLIPLIFILPCFIGDKVFAVFLAEPVSDILAAAVTTLTFFLQFKKILKRTEIR